MILLAKTIAVGAGKSEQKYKTWHSRANCIGVLHWPSVPHSWRWHLHRRNWMYAKANVLCRLLALIDVVRIGRENHCRFVCQTHKSEILAVVDSVWHRTKLQTIAALLEFYLRSEMASLNYSPKRFRRFWSQRWNWTRSECSQVPRQWDLFPNPSPSWCLMPILDPCWPLEWIIELNIESTSKRKNLRCWWLMRRIELICTLKARGRDVCNTDWSLLNPKQTRCDWTIHLAISDELKIEFIYLLFSCVCHFYLLAIPSRPYVCTSQFTKFSSNRINANKEISKSARQNIFDVFFGHFWTEQSTTNELDWLRNIDKSYISLSPWYKSTLHFTSFSCCNLLRKMQITTFGVSVLSVRW